MSNLTASDLHTPDGALRLDIIDLLSKRQPLRADECRRETTCSLCAGPLSPGDWKVNLTGVRGAIAHTHCAFDYGWSVV